MGLARESTPEEIARMKDKFNPKNWDLTKSYNITTDTTESEKFMFNTYLPYVLVAVAIGLVYYFFIKK